MSYSDKLRLPKWQRKRLEILSRDNFICCNCSDNETELQVHHKEYKNGCEPWEYDNSNFETLCKDCHTIIEIFRKQGLNVLILKKKINLELNSKAMTAYFFTQDGVKCVAIFDVIDNTYNLLLSISEATIIMFSSTMRDLVNPILKNHF